MLEQYHSNPDDADYDEDEESVHEEDGAAITVFDKSSETATPAEKVPPLETVAADDDDNDNDEADLSVFLPATQ